MYKPTPEEIQDALDDGYSPEDVERGWIISTNPDGVEGIEKLDALPMFDTDRQAANAARRAGVKLISDMPGVRKNIYLDTPENRRLLAQIAMDWGSTY